MYYLKIKQKTLESQGIGIFTCPLVLKKSGPCPNGRKVYCPFSSLAVMEEMVKKNKPDCPNEPPEEMWDKLDIPDEF